MTEKRFRKVLGLICDNKEKKLLDLTEIEEMLNALDEENSKQYTYLKVAYQLIIKYAPPHIIEQWKKEREDLR